MLILTALLCCNQGPLDPDDVRSHLENPTARLAADNLPGVTDDFFGSSESWAGEGLTNGWLGVFRGDSTLDMGMARTDSRSLARRVGDVAGMLEKSEQVVRWALIGGPPIIVILLGVLVWVTRRMR